MDTTLSVLLFLVPGLLALRISQALDPEYKDRITRTSEIESTVFAVLNNLPGILVGWSLWDIHDHKNLGFAQWTSQITNFRGAITFVIVSFLLALWVEKKLKPWIKKWAAEKRNEERERKNLPKFDSSEVWEVFIGAEDELCMRITTSADNSNVITGMIDAVSKPDDSSQGITLLYTDELALINEKLVSPIRTYFDSRTAIMYEIFDTEAVKKAYEELDVSS